MKKTISISIGKVLFHIEEDAYHKLAAYLEAIKARFTVYADGEEIIADIEGRIAEHFTKGHRDNHEHIVTMHDVDKLMTSMGSPDEFGQEEKESTGTSSTSTHTTSSNGSGGASKNKKRLYRDMDDVVIAGVASGLAEYFGIEPVIMRIAFILLSLLHGFGIALYAILWMIVPEAKTPTEKMQMKGDPVTLEAVDRFMKETASKIKGNKQERRSGVRSLIATIAGSVGLVIRVAIQVLIRIIGTVLVFAMGLSIFAVTALTVVVLANVHSQYVNFPLAAAVHGGLFYLVVIMAFIVTIVPLFFIMEIGKMGMRLQKFRRHRWQLNVLGVWLIALIVLAAAAVRAVPQVKTFIENDPEYRTVTRTYDLKDFTNINVRNSVHMDITPGATFAVTAEGATRSLDTLALNVDNGTLSASRGIFNDARICIFCDPGSIRIHVTMPVLDSIDAENSADVIATASSTSPTFMVTLHNSADLDMQLFASSTPEVDVNLDNSSRATITGITQKLSATLHNSSALRASNLVAEQADINTENSSFAAVNVTKSLHAVASNSSLIRYEGDAAVEKETKNGASVQKIDAAPVDEN